MKKIYEFKDDILNKKYDLYVSTFKELREVIVESSGMSIDEIRLKYDSLAPKDTLQINENIEIYNQEVLDSLKIKYKDSTLFNRIKRVINNDTVNPDFFIEPNFRSFFVTEEDTEMILKNVEKLKTANNLQELLALYNTFEIEKSVDIRKSKYSRNEYKISMLQPFKTKSSKYSDDLELTIYLKYLINGDTSNFKNLYKSLSKTYNKNAKESYENYGNRNLKKIFSEVRSTKSKLGFENYNFVVEELNDGKYILLDGFNRLFGSSYEPLDKEVMVKVYKNVSEREYSSLVLNLNDWKINSSSQYKKDYFKVFDRGMLFSMDSKFNIDLKQFLDYFTAYSSFIENNIFDITKREFFIENLKKAEQAIKYLRDSNFDKKIINTILLGVSSKYYSQNLIDDSFISRIQTWASSDSVKSSVEKVNSYSNGTLALKYLRKEKLWIFD